MHTGRFFPEMWRSAHVLIRHRRCAFITPCFFFFFFKNNMLKPEAAQPVWMIQGCFQTNVWKRADLSENDLQE